MCGLAGVLNRDRAEPADEALVRRMCERLAHRGPDDEGFYTKGPIGLGHRRLSIVDLEGGHQPMFSRDGSLAIVYNGEVYNFRELRRELEHRGHAFATRSDTEVVLAAYAEFGTEFASRLNGMFAIALWDERRGRLVLARDRLGIKPLYLYEGERRLAFGSELKALFELPEFDRSWDLQAVHDYFQLLYVPEPRTIFRRVRKLPAGSVLVCEQDRVREWRYWELRPEAPEETGGTTRSVEALLEDSVQLRTVADVPLGAFLSGGIDSGLVVAALSRAMREPVNTFTVYDPDVPFYDERDRARAVAERFGTNHREISAKTDVRSLLEEMVPTFDEPHADSGALPNLVVCRETRRFAKVALSGLGGDEIAGGYVRYAGMQWTRFGGLLPRGVWGGLSALAGRLPEGEGLAVDRLKRLLPLMGIPEAERYARMLAKGQPLSGSLFREGFLGSVDRNAPVELVRGHLERAAELGLDPVNRLLYTDLLTYIPGDLLTVADRTSMRVGLEVRVPFLDYRLVGRALAVSGREKVRRGRLKLLLRRMARRSLPREIVEGPKRGFSVPMADWLRGPLAAEVEEVVEHSGPATGVLERDALRACWKAHRQRRRNYEEALWAALVFARWASGPESGSPPA